MVAVLVAPLVSSQPPPPHRESIIIFFNDSSCTHHLHTERIAEESSSKCVPEDFRGHNNSHVFECVAASNVTSLTLQFYNDTAACDTTPLFSYAANGAEHSCLPITITFEGETETAYGRVDCAPQNQTGSVAYVGAGAKKITNAVHIAPQPTPVKVSHKTRTTNLINKIFK